MLSKRCIQYSFEPSFTIFLPANRYLFTLSTANWGVEHVHISYNILETGEDTYKYKSNNDSILLIQRGKSEQKSTGRYIQNWSSIQCSTQYFCAHVRLDYFDPSTLTY